MEIFLEKYPHFRKQLPFFDAAYTSKMKYPDLRH